MLLKLKTLVISGLLLPGAVLAAVPADVTTAIETAETDGVAVATAVLVAIVALFGFRLMRRALR